MTDRHWFLVGLKDRDAGLDARNSASAWLAPDAARSYREGWHAAEYQRRVVHGIRSDKAGFRAARAMLRRKRRFGLSVARQVALVLSAAA